MRRLSKTSFVFEVKIQAIGDIHSKQACGNYFIGAEWDERNDGYWPVISEDGKKFFRCDVFALINKEDAIGEAKYKAENKKS